LFDARGATTDLTAEQHLYGGLSTRGFGDGVARLISIYSIGLPSLHASWSIDMDAQIERRFKERSRGDQPAADERRLPQHRTEAIKVNATDYMKRLVDSAAVQMTYVNEKFPARMQVAFRRTPGMGFLLDRSRFPAVSAKCELTDESMSVPVIHVGIHRRAYHDAPTYNQQIAFNLDLDEADNIVARGAGRSFSDPEVLAGFILESVIFGS
jgi:hypothetical protein